MTNDVSSDLIDVGGNGIAGHYSKMIGRLRAATQQTILVLDIWWWFLCWPLGHVIYQISPRITLAGVIALALTLWSARVGWEIMIGVGFGARWLKLEQEGLQWSRRNDQNFRVIYRRSDGSTQIDTSTREQRVNQELSNRRYRNQSILTHGLGAIGLLVGYLLLPIAVSYFYDLIGPEDAATLARWHCLDVIEWLWAVPLMLPAFGVVGWDLFERAVYASGAQFIPGAQVRDPLQAPQTIDTIREEQAYGDARFIPPDDVAQQMSQ